MRKKFEMPELSMAIFASENVVTASGDLTKSETYQTTINNIINGKNQLVENASQIMTFAF